MICKPMASEPSLILIPVYSFGHAAGEVVVGVVAQLVHSGLDVTTPVALAQDVELVVVEG